MKVRGIYMILNGEIHPIKSKKNSGKGDSLIYEVIRTINRKPLFLKEHLIRFQYSLEAKEMFDEHVKQSELLKVPLPSHNRIIKDYERFLDYRNNRMANNWNFTKYLWNEDTINRLQKD